MKLRAMLLGWLTGLAAMGAWAADLEVFVVKDLDVAPESSLPRTILALPDGRTLVSVDRTTGEPKTIVTDLTPAGTDALQSFPSEIVCPDAIHDEPFAVTVGGFVYVLASGLRRIESTTSPRVADFACPNEMIAIGDSIFVLGRLANRAQQGLYSTDGFADPTHLSPFMGPLELSWLTEFNGEPWYTSFLATTGEARVWRSDGTQQGTAPALTGFVFVSDLLVFQGQLYFFADDGISGLELWRSDGTQQGTTLVFDAMPGPEGSRPDALTIAGPRLYWRADDGVNGTELWSSDGTPAGTGMARDAWPGPAGSRPRELTAVGDTLFFVANDGLRGDELWLSRGPGATYVAGDARPGGASSDPQELTASDWGLFWSADDGVHGRELWVASEAGTDLRMVEDRMPGPLGSDPSQLVFSTGFDCPGFLWASLFDPDVGREVFVSDGLEIGLARDTTPINASSNPLAAGRLGDGRLLLVASSDTSATTSESTLWVTDGTTAGTTRLGPATRAPVGILGDGTAVFAGSDTDAGVELFHTDGTPEGTRLLKDLDPGSDSSSPTDFVTGADGQVYFAASDMLGREPWVSDGTEGGTRRLADLRSGPSGSNPSKLRAVGPRVLFLADDGVHGQELFGSDGTGPGTGIVADLGPGPETSFIADPTVVGDRLYFSANDWCIGWELWSSDGTEAGTQPVIDLNPDARHGMPVASGATPPFNGRPLDSIAAAGDRLLFGAFSGIWGTDGSEAETVELLPSNNSAFSAVEAGGLAYFNRGGELWRSDATVGGTFSLGSAFGAGLANASTQLGRLYYGPSGMLGPLVSSDGSVAGTRSLGDVVPPPDTSMRASRTLGIVRGRLLLAADDFVRGVELWAVDLDSDLDGVPDAVDNCRFTANPDQADANAMADDDGSQPGIQHYGDACDADLDDDGLVGASDFFGLLRGCLGADLASRPECALADLDGDGSVAASDFFGGLRPALGSPPGPGPAR